MYNFSYSSILKRGLDKTPISKPPPEPVKNPKQPVDRLKLVIDAARSRGHTNRLPPKVNTKGYEQQYGMTCVMNPTKETVKVFGKPFYNSVTKDPLTRYVFFPVSPVGFHVTLLGLEYANIQLGDKSYDEIRSELRTAQDLLDETLPGPIKFEVLINEDRPELVVYPSDTSDKEKLRELEMELKERLDVRKRHPQSWHVTLGYFHPLALAREREVAMGRIKYHVKTILDDISPHSPFLNFIGPKITVYRDHTRYYPLFNR